MQKSSAIDLWLGSKYVSERFLISGGFEVELFEVELAAFQEFFPVVKRSFT